MKIFQLPAVLLVTLAAPLVLDAADAAKPYPLQACFISGEKFSETGKPIVSTYAGQEVKFCCRECKNEFRDDPVAGMKKFDAAVAQAAANK